jgi:hypothetical protein
MKKSITILSVIFTILIGYACKKQYPIVNSVVQNQADEQRLTNICQAPCPIPVGTAIVTLSSTAGRTWVRLSVYYYFTSNKKGNFDVTINGSEYPQIPVGRFSINNVSPSPLDGSLGVIDIDFLFPINVFTYPSYIFIVKGRSFCNSACSSFLGSFIP